MKSIEGSCSHCHSVDVLYALYPDDEEHQEWLCESCETIALARQDGEPLNPPYDSDL